jgi:anthranilate/para-aminobenzoate synthase component II
MKTKIFVTRYLEYGAALSGLGDMTGNSAEFIHSPEKFKLVLFTGGEDVDPGFYSETSPHGLCQFNTQRDGTEMSYFTHAFKNKIPMTGICRGLQFINVMAGGRLIHHLNGHNNGHHDFGCQKDDDIRRVNSLHHQMAIPPKDAFIVGWSLDKLADRYHGDEDKKIWWPGPEVESVIYPSIKACGVQYHPEMMDPETEGYKFFYNMVSHMLTHTMEAFVKIYTGKADAANAT